MQEFFILDVDSYGQPTGLISSIFLNVDEFKKLKNKGIYVYKDYETALNRAQN